MIDNNADKTDRLWYAQDGFERLKAASSVLIVGGGPVGVELAGEIAEELPGKQASQQPT